MYKNLKAFTLVEVIVSITILGILFTFLFETTNSTKKLNKPYIQKANKIHKEAKVFQTFVKDFTQIVGASSAIYGKKYDIVRFKTKNSIHNIIEPYITYFISRKDLTLIRTESLEKYDLYNKEDIYKEFIYSDILVSQVHSFKVLFSTDFINILLRTKELSPIVLKVPRVN